MTEREEPSPTETQDPQRLRDAARRCLIAVHNLSDKDVRTLYGFAALKMFKIRAVVFSADPGDLVQESIKRTLTGERTWSEEEPDFVKHLKQCISSIGNDLARRAYLEQEAVREFERARSRPEGDPLYNKELLEATRLELTDEIALAVFDRLLQGFTRAETCRQFHLRSVLYDAARKRISRALFAVAAELGSKKMQRREEYNEQGGQHGVL